MKAEKCERTPGEQSSSTKPRAFIGCSSEAKKLGEAVQRNLESWCYPELWTQGFFMLSATTIESLEKRLPEYAFAVFLLTPDDATIIRRKKQPAPRDNLILEVGLSIGILGRFRTFLVIPRDSSDLRLPTDILDVTCAEYDPAAPNPVAALGPACNKIRDAMGTPALRPDDLLRASIGKAIRDVHPHHLGEVETYLRYLSDMVFSTGVLRRNWTIDLSYDFSKIAENVIRERIVWDYEFINVTSRELNYPMRLFSLVDESNSLISFTRMHTNGKKEDVFINGQTTVESLGVFARRQRTVLLPPGVSHFISMRFEQDHPVSPQRHYIHNAFAPIEPTLSAQLKIRVPDGYRADVLGREIIAPTKLHDHWDFRIPGPLLPEQIIEYMVQKEVSSGNSSQPK